MTTLRCYVDDRTLAILTEYGQRSGRSVEELAEAAISDAAIRSLPPPPGRSTSWCGTHQCDFVERNIPGLGDVNVCPKCDDRIRAAEKPIDLMAALRRSIAGEPT